MRSVRETCEAAKRASKVLATVRTDAKDAVLLDIADTLEARSAEIVAANADDVARGREAGLTDALIDRLTLTDARVTGMANGLRQVVGLKDPVGEVVAGWTLPDGLEIRKVRVPLGVVSMI
ncbi:MAG: gamma-glutamyl-phosphate reductase, partial [Actinobacteria bacterium]|nr:gamma-glutamyl-phosphate reductase [Actinomycetota bacterium]